MVRVAPATVAQLRPRIRGGLPPRALRRVREFIETHLEENISIQALADIAEDHFAEARAAIKQCSRRAMRPARAMGAVYHAQLARLRARGWQRFAEPIKLSKPKKLWIALRYGLI